MDYSTMKSLLLIFIINFITIQLSQANSPNIFTLDVLENDLGESEYWTWDCNYSKNQIYLEFQDLLDPEDPEEGFFTPGFGLDKCKISFDIKKFVPSSIGFQGYLKRGAQVEINMVYGKDLENFRIASDLLDDNGVWTNDLKYYEEMSENFHIEFILHTSTSLNQNDVEFEYDHSIALVDKIWIIAYPSASDDYDLAAAEAESIEENDFENLTDDDDEINERTDEPTETPETEKPLIVIGQMSTLQDIEDSEDWDTNCDYEDSTEGLCTPVLAPDGKTGFFAPCTGTMQFRCTIVYSNDRREIFSFKPNVFIDGNGKIEVSTESQRKNMGLKNERVGIIGSWDDSEKLLNEDDDDQSKITFTLIGSGRNDVAIVESIVIMGWEKDVEPVDENDSKTLMIVLISVGGVMVLVGLGAALYFFKKRSERLKNGRNNYEYDDAAESYPNTSTQYNYKSPPRKSGQANQGFSAMEDDNSTNARRYFSSTPKQLLTRESSAGLGVNNPTNYGGVPLPGLASTEDQGFSKSGNRMSFSNPNYQQNDPTGANRFRKQY